MTAYLDQQQGDPGDENDRRCRNCGEPTDRFDPARERWLCAACVEEFDWKLAEAYGGDDGE